MKKLILLLSMTVSAHFVQAQKLPDLLYADACWGGGSGFNMRADLNYETEGFLFGGGFNVNVLPVLNLPADYTYGYRVDIGFFPNETAMEVQLFSGKVWYRHTNKVRFKLKGGICLGSLHQAVSYSPVFSPSFYESNYDINFANKVYGGGFVAPEVMFPLARGFGFTVGVEGNYNTVRSTASIYAGIIFGRCRAKTIAPPKAQPKAEKEGEL